jgi:uncharacterized membrane protein
MRKNLLPYLACFAVLLALDALWLGWIATDWYDTATGHLAAEVPSLGAAAAFYLIFPVGILIFVVRWGEAQPHRWVAARGALFGFFAYATYNLTNLATLADWPVYISLVDMAWGSAVTAASSVAANVCINAQRR